LIGNVKSCVDFICVHFRHRWPSVVRQFAVNGLIILHSISAFNQNWRGIKADGK